jgi:hypothetical protein
MIQYNKRTTMSSSDGFVDIEDLKNHSFIFTGNKRYAKAFSLGVFSIRGDHPKNIRFYLKFTPFRPKPYLPKNTPF